MSTAWLAPDRSEPDWVAFSIEPDPCIFCSIFFPFYYRAILLPYPFMKVMTIGNSIDMNFPSWLKDSIINCWRWQIGIWGFTILLLNKFFKTLLLHTVIMLLEKEKEKEKNFIHAPDTQTNQFLFLPSFFQSYPCAHIIFIQFQSFMYVFKHRSILTPFLSTESQVTTKKMMSVMLMKTTTYWASSTGLLSHIFYF